MTISIAGGAGLWRGLALSLALIALPMSGALAQRDAPREGVAVGKSSKLSHLVPAQDVENAAGKQYHELLQQAASKRALAQPDHPQLQRIRAIAKRLIPQAVPWNERAAKWNWEVNLIGSNQINAFCMPGGKIAVFAGILEKLKLSDDEVAMVLGHEMAHALREHARERIAKSQGTGVLLSLGASLFGLGELGHAAASVGTQLLTLKFGRDDEIEADLIGLDLGARTGFDPKSSVTLWQKMAKASGSKGGPAFLSTHPSGTDRIKRLQANIPRVEGLYQQSTARR